ncbi:DUF3810 domain-containing protein [Salinimicrobium sp. CDJ15-81-2]|nr:DUF3810 domain-containing protein [Salinimicrobium nanhaiense]
MNKKAALILALFLPVQLILIRILSGYPNFVERWYSNGIYPFTSALLRKGLGFIPFSLGDLLYALLVVMLIRWFALRVQQRFREPKRWIINGIAVLSLVYFCFNLFWGFNYYRLPLHQALEMEDDYTTEELINLTRDLITTSNDLQYSLTGNDSLKVELPHSKSDILDLSITGYKNLEENFPELNYSIPSLKRSLYSLPLTYMGFNGYLNPLTNEGQVNTLIVPYKIPTTASHEIGHQLGFAKENEANFLACLTTMNHPDAYFRYSGYTFALSYCLSELYRRDQALAEELLEEVNFGIKENYREVREFWESHANPFEPLFMFTYNSFLVANNQPEGMRSYSYVVALLVNYHKSRGRM